jgi:hypothetical protein
MNDYANMIQGLPQGGDQSNYLASMGMQKAPGVAQNGLPANAPGAQNSQGLPRLSQGQAGMGPQGMPSNGQGQQQGGNPFLAAIARWHAMQQRPQGQPGMPPAGQMQARGPQQPGVNPFPGVQWGPQPLPQGMRAPGSMPPPGQVPGMQGVQWGGPVQMRQPPGPLAQNGNGQ